MPNPVTGQEPKTFDALAQLLRRQFQSLTPNQQRLARQLLSDPEGCAFMTISELAKTVGVNESTVVRFSTALGLDGYPALVRLCQERLREQAQLIRRFDALEQLSGTGTDLLEGTVALDQANIARTFARVQQADWDRAVRALADGRVVYVMGLRKTHTVAYLLSYLLQIVRDDVECLVLGPGTLPDRLRRLGPGDTFVAAGIYRYSREVVRSLRFARERGATTIALTDNPSSPLARYAEVAFYCDTAGVSILRSLTALVSLAQTLVAGVAARLGTTTRSALLLEEEVLREFQVYEAEAEHAAGLERASTPELREPGRPPTLTAGVARANGGTVARRRGLNGSGLANS
jgi:DNA-binding MurR/RpiR family transcriptional regulator